MCLVVYIPSCARYRIKFGCKLFFKERFYRISPFFLYIQINIFHIQNIIFVSKFYFSADKMKRALYLHGFLSSGNGSSTFQYLKKKHSDKFEWFAIDIDYACNDLFKLMSDINKYVIENNIDIIVGSSMGGWLANHCGENSAIKLAVNPPLNPYKLFVEQINGKEFVEWKYFNKREDGQEICRITREIVGAYGLVKPEFVFNTYRVFVFSQKDNLLHHDKELIDFMIKEDENYLKEIDGHQHVYVVNSIKHRMSKAFVDIQLIPIMLDILEMN